MSCIDIADHSHLTKLRMSPGHFPHRAIVCLPGARATRLRGSVPSVASRHTLSDTMLVELEKTAGVISQEPWTMTAGAECLLKFVKGNCAGTNGGTPPDIAWVWQDLVFPDIPEPHNRIDEIDADALIPDRKPQVVRVGSGPSKKRSAAAVAEASGASAGQNRKRGS